MSGIQDRNHTVDVHAELEAPQPYLLKIARLQLRNDTWAEDVVSETTLTALEKIATFDGRSRLRTWVVAILRNKVIDHLRRNKREVTLGQEDVSQDDAIETLIFNARGGFLQPPQPWPDPEGAMAERQYCATAHQLPRRPTPNPDGPFFSCRA